MNTPGLINTFLITMLLSTLILLVVTRLTTERLISQHHGQKKDFFINHPIQNGDIVFVGDSLTDGCRWDEVFPDFQIKNRGINGDLTTGVLIRLPELLDAHPKAIFLQIGTNDLPWYEYRNDEQIIHTYEQIIRTCQELSPETRLYLESILPREKSYAKRIQSLNKQIADLAEKYQCTYIHLFPHFADQSSRLRKELTNDSLHLLGDGYQIWKAQLQPFLDELKPDLRK